MNPSIVSEPRMLAIGKAVLKNESALGSTNGSMIQYAKKTIGTKTLVTPEIGRNAGMAIRVPSNVLVRGGRQLAGDRPSRPNG